MTGEKTAGSTGASHRENESGESEGRVCAVIVTYYPDVRRLDRLLAAVRPQVGQVLIIDNATADENFGSYIGGLLSSGVSIVRNAANEGVGAAFNCGERWARQNDYRYLLLLDQDSLVYPDMVSRLLAAYAKLSGESPVAAVGPAFIDARTNMVEPFVRVGFPLNKKIYSEADDVVRCDFLISSGTLMPMSVLADVGAMDESLFIDNVDLEWCFRARKKGYSLYGVGAALMEHQIGDMLVSLPYGLGRVTVHSPIRLYYMMRNRLLLYRRRSTPKLWIAQDFPRAFLKLLRFALFLPPRIMNARYMWRGVRDGWRQVGGRYNDLS